MLQLGDLTTTVGIVGILIAANIRQNVLLTPTEKRTVLIPKYYRALLIPIY